METLVARWKAQKSASKNQNQSLDEMKMENDTVITNNSTQFFSNTLKENESSGKKDEKTRRKSLKSKQTRSQKILNSQSPFKNTSNIIHNTHQNNTSTQNLTQQQQYCYNQNNFSTNNNNISNIKSQSPSKKLFQTSFKEEINQLQQNSINKQIPPKPVSQQKKNQTYIIDESLYKIMDLFKNFEQQKQMPYQEKVSKIRDILENTVQTTQFMQNPRIQQLEEAERSLAKLKTQQQSNLQDAHSKIIQELENKLFESERNKIQLQNQVDALKNKVSVLEKQLENQQVTIDMWDKYRKSSEIIENNNVHLQKELKQQKQINQDQQIIFDSQVKQISQIINGLKEQMLQNSQNQYNINNTDSEIDQDEEFQKQLSKI